MRITATTSPKSAVIGRVLGWATVLTVMGAACVGNHPKTCTQSSDCEPGGICDGRGFCAHECRSNIDCPCGSTCNRSCGLCLLIDNGRLATCFAIDLNVTADEAIGACRNPSFLPEDGGAAPDLDGGSCQPAAETLTCGLDASTPPPEDASAGGMATTTDDAAATGDAATSEAGP